MANTDAVSITEVASTAWAIGHAGAAVSVGTTAVNYFAIRRDWAAALIATRAFGYFAISRCSEYRDCASNNFVGCLQIFLFKVMLHQGHHASKIIESSLSCLVVKIQTGFRGPQLLPLLLDHLDCRENQAACQPLMPA